MYDNQQKMSNDNQDILAKCTASISLITPPTQSRASITTYHSQCSVMLSLRENVRMSGTDCDPYNHGELLFHIHLDKVKGYDISKAQNCTLHKIEMANGRLFQLDFDDNDDFRHFLATLRSTLASLVIKQKTIAVPEDDFLISFPEASPRAIATVSKNILPDVVECGEDTNPYVSLIPPSTIPDDISEDSDDDDYDKILSGNMCQNERTNQMSETSIPERTDPFGPTIPGRPIVQRRHAQGNEVPVYDDLRRSGDGSSSRRDHRPLPPPRPPTTLPSRPPKPQRRTIAEDSPSNVHRANERTNQNIQLFNNPSPPTRSAQNQGPAVLKRETQPVESPRIGVNARLLQPSSSSKTQLFNPVSAELADAFNVSCGLEPSSFRRGNRRVDDCSMPDNDITQTAPPNFQRVTISPSIVRTHAYSFDGRSTDSLNRERTGTGIKPAGYRPGDLILEIEYMSTPMYDSTHAISDGNRVYIVPGGTTGQAELERAGFVISAEDDEQFTNDSALRCDICWAENGVRNCRMPWKCRFCTCDNACSKKECNACDTRRGNVSIGGIQQNYL